MPESNEPSPESEPVTAGQVGSAPTEAPLDAIPLHRERPSWVTLVLPALFLVVLAVGVYLPAVHGPFIFDDFSTLIGPQGVLAKAAQDPWSLLQGHRPLADVSFVMNAWITGDSPASFRLVNVAMHILAGLVLLDLVRRTLASPRFEMRWVNLATPLAAVIAGLWLVHPLQTQAVTYLSQRSEIMATLCMFIALDALAMAAGGGRCGRLVKGIVIFACVCAMLSKQIGYLTPVLLLLYDRTFWAQSFGQCFKQRPILYTAAALSLIVAWVIGLGEVFTTPAANAGVASAGFGTQGVSPWLYFFSEQSVLVHYLQLVIWPGTLVLDYRLALMEPAILANWPGLAHGLSLSVMLTLGVLTAWAMWRRPAWGFVGAWFFLILAPTSSFLPIVDLVMEHRMYGASAAVLAAMVMGVTMLLLWAAKLKHCRRSNTRLLGMMLFLGVLSALSVRTVNRNMDYASAMRLWGKVHHDRPTNTRAMLVLGKLVEPRDPRRALSLYEQAARTEPFNYEPMIALGSFYLINNQPGQAGKWYEVSYRQSGDELTYLLNMGLVAEAKGDLTAAAHYLTQARLNAPGNRQILTNLGMVLDQLASERLRGGDVDGAMSLRQKAVDAQQQVLDGNPSYEQAQVNLATTLVNLGMQQMLAGDGRAALLSFEKSLAVQQRADTARRMAWLLATWPEALTQNWDGAVKLAQNAQAAQTQMSGRQPLYMETTAAAYARAGRYEDAVLLQKEAISIAREAGLAEAKLGQSLARLALYEKGKAYLHKPSISASSDGRDSANQPVESGDQ